MDDYLYRDNVWVQRYRKLSYKHRALLFAIDNYYNIVNDTAVAARIPNDFDYGMLLKANAVDFKMSIERGFTAEYWKEKTIRYCEEHTANYFKEIEIDDTWWNNFKYS